MTKPRGTGDPSRGRPSSGRAAAKLPGPAWQVQTAKSRFCEVFRLARSEGPQLITRQGKEAVVMLAAEQYEKLVSRPSKPTSLVQFFRESPLVGLELEFVRDKDSGRDIEL